VTITIRRAVAADVPAMSEVMTASVRELCVADHHGDPDSIAAWVANRTPAGVTRMLANPDQSFFVAERAGALAAVGAVNRDGKVIFNYVSPAHRFAGVSSALMAHLEQVLREAGQAEATLVSTVTARRFYLERGWTPDGPPVVEGFSTSHPMRKSL
jgi:GNAT superfamily N-acetyltransferase